MNIQEFLLAGLLSLAPISELRGGIPYCFYKGMPIFYAFLYCTAINALAGPLAYVFLSTFHKLFYKINFYKNFFDRFVEKARLKVHKEVEKYGYWGLMVFVAIPLPMTGAWTGILGGWILGMEPKKVMGAVALGVLIAGIVVSCVLGFGVTALSFFYKV